MRCHASERSEGWQEQLDPQEAACVSHFSASWCCRLEEAEHTAPAQGPHFPEQCYEGGARNLSWFVHFCRCHGSRTHTASAGQYSLAVFWRGDDDLEYFTLRCRNEEQLRMWETQLNRLIQEVANRRASGRSHQRLAHLTQTSYGPNGSSLPRATSFQEERGYSTFSQSTAYSPVSHYHSGPVPGRMSRHPYAAAGDDPTMSAGAGGAPYGNGYGGPQGYPPPDGFDLDLDDEFEEYPPSSRPSSGRGTPMGARRPEFNSLPSSGSTRSSTHGPASASATFASPYGSGRPSLSRNTGSFATENGVDSGLPRASLRNQYSATKLKSAYDKAESR